MSAKDMKRFLNFDLVGICTMLCGTAVSPIYYTFMCESSYGWCKLWLTQIFCASFLALFILFKCPNASSFLLGFAWIGAAVSALPGTIHAAYFLEEGQAMGFKLTPWTVGEFAYGIGAVLYATNTPERWVKGKFDYLGHGHNLFHMGCIIGALIHIWASLKCFHERQLFSCPETGLHN